MKAALEAGTAIGRHFAADFEVSTKSDSSPVTAADHEAEAIILHALADLDPTTPVVAEEEVAAGRMPGVDARFWLVDPLDGTREFINKGSDFTVNIALVESDRATLGVVYAPARAELYVGDTLSCEAWEARCELGGSITDHRPLRVRSCGESLVAVASRSHADPATDQYLAGLPISERISVGSSLKFCLIARGEADIYPRTGPTMEWDTAAGQAVLEAAGGLVVDSEGLSFRYGKPGFRNTAFVATGGAKAPALAPVLAGSSLR